MVKSSRDILPIEKQFPGKKISYAFNDNLMVPPNKGLCQNFFFIELCHIMCRMRFYGF